MRIECHETIRNPEAYVMTVAGHVLQQHTLRLATTPENLSALDVLVDLQAAIESDLVAAIDAQRRLEALDAALEGLSPNLHATFVLHRRDGMTLEEIAKVISSRRTWRMLVRHQGGPAARHFGFLGQDPERALFARNCERRTRLMRDFEQG